MLEPYVVCSGGREAAESFRLFCCYTTASQLPKGSTVHQHKRCCRPAAAAQYSLARQPMSPGPSPFNPQVPEAVSGVPTEVLLPVNCWADKAAYGKSLAHLAALFANNFTRFEVRLTQLTFLFELGSTRWQLAAQQQPLSCKKTACRASEARLLPGVAAWLVLWQ